jgi:hypothetical protein
MNQLTLFSEQDPAPVFKPRLWKLSQGWSPVQPFGHQLLVSIWRTFENNTVYTVVPNHHFMVIVEGDHWNAPPLGIEIRGASHVLQHIKRYKDPSLKWQWANTAELRRFCGDPIFPFQCEACDENGKLAGKTCPACRGGTWVLPPSVQSYIGDTLVDLNYLGSILKALGDDGHETCCIAELDKCLLLEGEKWGVTLMGLNKVNEDGPLPRNFQLRDYPRREGRP